MENQPQPHRAPRKNSQSVRSMTGESSQPPQDPEAQKPTSAAQTAVTVTSRTKTTTEKGTAPEVSAAAPSTTVKPPVDDSESERVMREFSKKFGPNERASDVLARMAEEFRLQEEASQLTPLNIPPRPSTLQETPTAQALTSHRNDPQISTETLPLATEPPSAATHDETPPTTSAPAPDLPHAEEVEYTVEEVMEEAEKVGMGSERGEVGERVEDVDREDVEGEDDVVDDGNV